MTGLIQDFDGCITLREINGAEVKISAIINSPSVFLNMTAYQNLKSQAYLLGIYDTNKIDYVMKMIGLAEARNKVARNFSLGMIQRLKLGMALLENPDLLILDEPSNGLDPDSIVEFRELLLKLSHAGMTIIISSHILSELEQLATYFGILSNGKIVKEISKEDILKSEMSLEDFYFQYTREKSDV